VAAWRPILEGERAGRARERVGWLTERLIDPRGIEPGRAAALLSGFPGVALALQAIGDEARAGEHLEAAAAASGTLAGEAGLARGVAGLAFAFELCDGGGEENGEDSNDAIDEALGEEVASDRTIPAELMRGLAGRAVYARERRARASGRALEEAIASRLVAMAEGAAWRTAPDPRYADRALCERSPAGWFDLGVAHGSPAIIATLAAAGEGGAARAGMDWMWRQRGPAGGPGFPALAGEEPRAQPGWCYGDEGIAAVLFAAARALGDETWSGRWLEVLRAAAERAVPAGGAALCHGAAGLAHIYNRVHQETGLDWAREAALARFAELEAALADSRERLPAGMLDGLAGVALALAAALGDREPAWDRALVLSLSPAPV
jgi:lantibiotic biosynthesis protein